MLTIVDTIDELTKHINEMIKETEKVRNEITDLKQDYYYTGYLDALSTVLQLLEGGPPYDKTDASD